MSYRLFLDDVRRPEDVKWISMPPGPWTTVRNFLDFKVVVATHGLPEHVSFDHDLAEEHYDPGLWKKIGVKDYATLNNATGYDCAVWLTEYCRDLDLDFPSYTVHSMNPIGKARIHAAIEQFKTYRHATIK